MKRLLLAFAGIAALAFKGSMQTITGNGNIKTETRSVEAFTGILSMGSINVDVAYGSAKSLTVDADDNLLPYIETEVKNGTLIIKSKEAYNLRSKAKLVVHVQAQTLNSVQLMGSGNIFGKGNFSSSADAKFALMGSGNLNMELGTYGTLKAAIAGSGNLTLSGKSAQNLEANVSGSGNIDCSQLAADNVEAKVSGSGNIRVYANTSIDAHVSGSGNVTYGGSPAHVNSRTSGSGKVRKA